MTTTFLRVILTFTLIIGGASTAMSLCLWWLKRRADRVNDVGGSWFYGGATGFALLAGVPSLLAAGGAGLWLAAITPDPAERATVLAVGIVVLVPPLALIGWGSVKPGPEPRNRYRWVTIDKASALLRASKISMFQCGDHDAVVPMPLRGRPTGIKSSKVDMWAEPGLRAILEPVAREARARTGQPRWIVIGDVWDPPLRGSGDGA